MIPPRGRTGSPPPHAERLKTQRTKAAARLKVRQQSAVCFPPPMSRRFSLVAVAVTAALVLPACGSEGIELDDGEQANIRHGAELFAARCSGCHSFTPVGTQ